MCAYTICASWGKGVKRFRIKTRAKNKEKREADKKIGLYTLNCLLHNFFLGRVETFKPHNKSERERERREDKEDNKEDKEEEDESSSGEELFFSSSFLLSFLYSFFGVFVVERLC